MRPMNIASDHEPTRPKGSRMVVSIVLEVSTWTCRRNGADCLIRFALWSGTWDVSNAMSVAKRAADSSLQAVDSLLTLACDSSSAPLVRVSTATMSIR